MKKLFLVLAFAAALPSFAADNKKALATVPAVHGVYVFVDCLPASPFDVMGTLSGVAPAGFYRRKKAAIIDRVKALFPASEGVIISFGSGRKYSASAVKFSTSFSLPSVDSSHNVIMH
jgi:hypothetical protein